MASPGNVVYEENDKPRMGTVRGSFRKNVLLLKSKLGTTKQVTTNLPDKDWIYGVCNEYDEEGVREVLIHKQNVPDLERKRGPDILAMNKLAAIRHASKACQQQPFRKKHLIRLHISRRIGKNPSAKLPSELDPNYIYGRPGEKNEEMSKIMEYGYSDEWIKMNLQHPHVFEEQKPNFTCPTWNRSARLRFRETTNKKYSIPPKERFIISRFKNVPKRIDNYNPTPLKRD